MKGESSVVGRWDETLVSGATALSATLQEWHAHNQRTTATVTCTLSPSYHASPARICSADLKVKTLSERTLSSESGAAGCVQLAVFLHNGYWPSPTEIAGLSPALSNLSLLIADTSIYTVGCLWHAQRYRIVERACVFKQGGFPRSLLNR